MIIPLASGERRRFSLRRPAEHHDKNQQDEQCAKGGLAAPAGGASKDSAGDGKGDHSLNQVIKREGPGGEADDFKDICKPDEDDRQACDRDAANPGGDAIAVGFLHDASGAQCVRDCRAELAHHR